MLVPEQGDIVQQIQESFIDKAGVELFLKREDLIHPQVSGNKWRKLKYNLEVAKADRHSTLLTFGGAFSNHIYATAAAAKAEGFQSIGIIRGEEHLPLNPTLAFAVDQGMQLHYMERSQYREKNTPAVIDMLKKRFGAFYLIPEGGTNALAVKGCTEIVSDKEGHYDFWCCPVGTGGTIAGIVAGLKGKSRVLGFSALKGGDFLTEEVNQLLTDFSGNQWQNWSIHTTYHFGGYAKTKPELIEFINTFESTHKIQLDPIYTGKMMFGIYDLIRQSYFPTGSKIIALHTGGLQGIEGMKMLKGMQ